MEIVAGLSLKNLEPRVWDSTSHYHIAALRAVMVSYADFHQMPARMKAAMDKGLHAYLGIPNGVKIYLDNGAFFFLRQKGRAEAEKYEEFVRLAKPDWWPIPHDAIPTPKMSRREQQECFECTMQVNRCYEHDGFVPVIHAGTFLPQYIDGLKGNPKLAAKGRLALGGMVPNLLRSPSAVSYADVLASLCKVRQLFPDKAIHVFGIGGTATLHLAALLGMNSVDSSGWRNRAARGIVQLPGSGDRMVTNLGSWRGREPSREEWDRLRQCRCPACKRYGIRGLKSSGLKGFCKRATHNLWILLEEAKWVSDRLTAGTYARCFRRRLDNSTYLPLIEGVIASGVSPRLT